MGYQQSSSYPPSASIDDNSAIKQDVNAILKKTLTLTQSPITSNINTSISNKDSHPNQIQPKQVFKYTISLQNLRDTFKTFAIHNDYLNRDLFNDAIESLFRFPMPEMHYTYLSEKIYDLLDDSGDGKIQEDEFIQGFKNVLTNKEFRIKLSMMAMMNKSHINRNSIEATEIKEFFYKSWVQGYKHLGWQIRKDKANYINRKIPIASTKQLEVWASRYENSVKASIEADLANCGIDTGASIDYETFKKWLYVDHTIYLSYANKSVKIATNLTQLDDIGFVEDTYGYKKSKTMMGGKGQDLVENFY